MKKYAGFLMAAVVVTLAAGVAEGQLVSGMGGMCLNAEGGLRPGARLIVWPCSGANNEQWKIGKPRGINETRIYTPNATTKAYDGTTVPYCAQAASRNDGAEIFAQPCDNNQTALQNFASRGGSTIGHNTGYCVDVRGGWGGWGITNLAGAVFGTNRNVPVILSGCHGQYNQVWKKVKRSGSSISKSSLSPGDVVTVAGKGGFLKWTGSGLIGADGGTLVAAGAGNLISEDGSTLVAAGGGNIVAAGAGN